MSKTLVIDNPSDSLRVRMEKASETKRKIKEHVNQNGSLKGLELPGVKFVKPF
jgi:hypothetical protein